jgi:hypothetical protein
MPPIQPPWRILRAKRIGVAVLEKSSSHTSHNTVLPHPTPTPTRSVLFFSTSAHLHRKAPALPPRPTLPDGTITHVYLKGSGPGGQKINKTNSAAQLTHLPTGIVVKSQATRSRSQNYTIARRILAEKVELLEKGDESRVMKRQERDRKKKASKSKKSRRKYRALERGDGEELDEDGEGLGPVADAGGVAELEGEERALDANQVENGDQNGTAQAKPPVSVNGEGKRNDASAPTPA